MHATHNNFTLHFSLLQNTDPILLNHGPRTMDHIESVEVPQPGVAFVISSKNNRAEVTKILADYGNKHKVRCVERKGPFEALTVHFKDPARCVDFYAAFVEATASRTVLRQITKIEDVLNRAKLRKKRAKIAARREKIDSEVVDSD